MTDELTPSGGWNIVYTCYQEAGYLVHCLQDSTQMYVLYCVHLGRVFGVSEPDINSSRCSLNTAKTGFRTEMLQKNISPLCSCKHRGASVPEKGTSVVTVTKSVCPFGNKILSYVRT